MGKTSTQETSQTIDPMLRNQMINNQNLVHALAAMGHNPFTGNLFAGFNAAQQGAAGMADSFANAFGFQGNAQAAMQEGAGTDDGSGIKGFSPFQGMKDAMGDEYDAFKAQLDDWFKQASKKTKYQEQEKASGGKK